MGMRAPNAGERGGQQQNPLQNLQGILRVAADEQRNRVAGADGEAVERRANVADKCL